MDDGRRLYRVPRPAVEQAACKTDNALAERSLVMTAVHPIAIPDEFNAATYFIDRHIAEGRGEKVAIECGDTRISYLQLFELVNRVGNGLRNLGVRMEERVFLLLLDTPEFAASFFGAIKIGAVPVPVHTLLKSSDYEYMLNNTRARVAIVSESLLPLIQEIPASRLRYLQTIVVVGGAPQPGTPSFESWTGQSPHCSKRNRPVKTMPASGSTPPAAPDEFFSELPKTATGKIQRFRLRHHQEGITSPKS